LAFKEFSGFPSDDLDGDLSMLADKRLCSSILRVHVSKFSQALLEFLTGWRVLSHSCNQLHIVQAGLLIQVVEKFNNLIELV